MKNTWNVVAIVLSVLLAIPSLSIAQDNDAPAGYLPAAEAGQAKDGAADAAPSGYLPAAEAGQEQGAVDEDVPAGYLPAGDAQGRDSDEIARAKEAGYAPAPTTVSSADTVDGGRLMILAYIGFWLLALGYIATLAQRARSTGREVVELHRQVQELDDRMEDIETRTRA